MNAVLFAFAAVLTVLAIINLLQGQVILGVVLLAAAAAVGPGGWSVFGRRG